MALIYTKKNEPLKPTPMQKKLCEQWLNSEIGIQTIARKLHQRLGGTLYSKLARWARYLTTN